MKLTLWTYETSLHYNSSQPQLRRLPTTFTKNVKKCANQNNWQLKKRFITSRENISAAVKSKELYRFYYSHLQVTTSLLQLVRITQAKRITSIALLRAVFTRNSAWNDVRCTAQQNIHFCTTTVKYFAALTVERIHQYKYVRLRGRTFIHTCRSYAWLARCRNRQEHGPRVWSSPHTNCAPAYILFWASGGAKFPKMGDSLPWTPKNHRAKFDEPSSLAQSSA